MSSFPSTGRGTRARKIEAFWSRVSVIVGCAALVAIVVAVILVITEKMLRKPVVTEDLLKQRSELPITIGKSDPKKALMESFSEGALRRVKPAAGTEHRELKQPAGDANVVVAPLIGAPPVPATPAMSIFDAMKPMPVIGGIDNIEDKREKIARALEPFFTAKTIDEKLLHVRDPQRVKPMMTSYYARESLPTVKFRGFGQAVRVDEPGYRFGYMQALFEDNSSVNLIVEETGQGGYLIDWEHLVRYGELSWAEFLRLKPAQPTLLRVLASRPVEVPSVAALAHPLCEWLELRHPDASQTVLGYFERGDPRYVSLVEQLDHGNWKGVPVTLKLCFPDSVTRREGDGVHITSVEGKAWLILENQKPEL